MPTDILLNVIQPNAILLKVTTECHYAYCPLLSVIQTNAMLMKVSTLMCVVKPTIISVSVIQPNAILLKVATPY